MLDDVQIKMQRARGRGMLRFASQDNRTRLRDLHQSGCLKLMLPRNHADVPDAVMINTAGGLTGGDSLSLRVELEKAAKLRLATQTSERIYQSTGDAAHVALDFVLGAGASLDWLAQETILFEGGQVARQINVDMTEDASLLMVEPVVLGRLAMGEQITSGQLHDRWRITREGKLCFADDTRLSDFEALQRPASLGSAKAFATILCVEQHAERHVDPLRNILFDSSLAGGVSAWNGQLVMRVLDSDPLAIRRCIMNAIQHIRGKAMPRVWTM